MDAAMSHKVGIRLNPIPVSLCDIDAVHNQGIDPAASPLPGGSSSREYFLQPLRNYLVFTRTHHPDRDVEQALASTRYVRSAGRLASVSRRRFEL